MLLPIEEKPGLGVAMASREEKLKMEDDGMWWNLFHNSTITEVDCTIEEFSKHPAVKQYRFAKEFKKHLKYKAWQEQYKDYEELLRVCIIAGCFFVVYYCGVQVGRNQSLESLQNVCNASN